MRIAYLADETKANGIYRGFAPMRALARLPGIEVRRLRDDEVQWTPGPDLLHIHRYCEIRALGLARGARASGAAVVWDNDDDQGAMPKSVATHKQFSGYAWQRRQQDIKRLFRATDLVTAPSATLAARLRELGAPATEVVENYLIDELPEPDRRPHQGLTIGWVAGLEHQMDLERLPIRAVLQRLLDERPDVHVKSVGLRLGLESDRYDARAGVPIAQLPQTIAEFDIAIAPLADIDFSRARSNVKLKEYAAAGVPWLASPIGPYAGMGEQEGGRLVADDDWHGQLSRLLDKPRERRKLAKRATRWARGQTLAANVGVWERTLARAVERARAAA